MSQRDVLADMCRDKKKNKKRKGNKLDFDLDAVYTMPVQTESLPAVQEAEAANGKLQSLLRVGTDLHRR